MLRRQRSCSLVYHLHAKTDNTEKDIHITDTNNRHAQSQQRTAHKFFNYRLNFYTSCTALYSGSGCEKGIGKGSPGNQLLPVSSEEGNLPKQGLESGATWKTELNMLTHKERLFRVHRTAKRTITYNTRSQSAPYLLKLSQAS